MQCSITTNGSLEPVVYVLDFVSQLWEEILEGFCICCATMIFKVPYATP